jgi:hypothetical protein
MQVGKEEPEEGSMVEVEDTDDYLLYLEDILKTVHKVGTAVPYLLYLEDIPIKNCSQGKARQYLGRVVGG